MPPVSYLIHSKVQQAVWQAEAVQHLWTGPLFCSFLWTLQIFGRLGSYLSMVHCWLGPPCVWVGGVLHCLVVQVGDQGIWCRMTGYISGAALTVILVLGFHQKDLCVCFCVGECVCMWAATSPGTTSACHTGRQLCIQTASIAHTFMHSYVSNFK